MFKDKWKWGVYLCAGVGILCLGHIPGYPPLAVGFFLLILIPSWFLSREREPFPGYRRAWSVAILLFILFTLFILVFYKMSPHLILAFQLSFVQISLAFNAYKSTKFKDALSMWFLALLMILVTSIKSRNTVMPLYIFLFLFLSVFALFWLGIHHEVEKTESTRKKKKRSRDGIITGGSWLELAQPMNRRMLRTARRSLTSIALAGFLLTMLLFILLPRFDLNKYGIPVYEDQSREEQEVLTGFSTNIHLGSLRRIQNNHKPVMEVKIKGAEIKESSLYLLGGTYDLFSGVAWMKSPEMGKHEIFSINPRDRAVKLPPLSSGFSSFPSMVFTSSSDLIEQEIRFIDFSSRNIFALPSLVMLSGPIGEMGENVYRDRGEVCFFLPPRTTNRYIAYSFSPFHEAVPFVRDSLLTSAGELVDAEYVDWIRSTPSFIQIPESFNQNRLEDLATRIIGKASTPYEKASRIESYLMNEYKYSLRLGALGSEQPVEDFLFSVKAGHCEIFATAMLMLLRTQDIPSRLAFGFHGGKYDKKTGLYTIRQSDAHTWVEVFDERRGWQRFDPTPPAPMAIYADRLTFKKIADFFTALSEKWQEFTVGYNNRYQTEIVSRIYRFLKGRVGAVFAPIAGSLSRSRALSRILSNLGDARLWVLAVVLILFNTGAILIYTRSRRRALREGVLPRRAPSRKDIILWYREIVRSLTGRTEERPFHLTPGEFLLSLGGEIDCPEPLMKRTCRIFYALRYDPHRDTTLLAEELGGIVKDLNRRREAHFAKGNPD